MKLKLGQKKCFLSGSIFFENITRFGYKHSTLQDTIANSFFGKSFLYFSSMKFMVSFEYL